MRKITRTIAATAALAAGTVAGSQAPAEAILFTNSGYYCTWNSGYWFASVKYTDSSGTSQTHAIRFFNTGGNAMATSRPYVVAFGTGWASVIVPKTSGVPALAEDLTNDNGPKFLPYIGTTC